MSDAYLHDSDGGWHLPPGPPNTPRGLSLAELSERDARDRDQVAARKGVALDREEAEMDRDQEREDGHAAEPVSFDARQRECAYDIFRAALVEAGIPWTRATILAERAHAALRAQGVQS